MSEASYELAFRLEDRSRTVHTYRHMRGASKYTWEDCPYLPCLLDRKALANPEAALPAEVLKRRSE